MSARAILSFLSACRERSRRVPLPTSNQNYLSPNIPTRLSRAPFERDTRPSRKSNHSRTSAIPGGGGICRFSCRTNSSRSFPRNPALCPLSFQSLAHSFIFRSTPISCLPNAFRTLAPKTGGTPLWSCQSYYSPPTNAPHEAFFFTSFTSSTSSTSFTSGTNCRSSRINYNQQLIRYSQPR